MVRCAWGMQAKPPPPPSAALLDFRPVLRNRPAMGFILSYGAHCFELYGIRTWIVAFWTFVIHQQAARDCLMQNLAGWITPMIVSVLFTCVTEELRLRCTPRSDLASQHWLVGCSAFVWMPLEGRCKRKPGKQHLCYFHAQSCLGLWRFALANEVPIRPSPSKCQCLSGFSARFRKHSS